MNGFQDHPVKKIIREQWCKPLLKNLFEKLGYKLTYLGLPGIEAIDILIWKEYLSKVIAFDIGHYEEPYNEQKANANILKLNLKLSELETKGIIENYSLYHGYIEEVVLKGIDRNRSNFNLLENVTIYNLDFCNSLTAPIKLTDPNTGLTSKFFKVDAIKRLLEIQSNISKINTNNTKFVLYLTVNSKFWETEAKKLFKGKSFNIYKKYVSELKLLNEKDRNARLLRLYIVKYISSLFCSNQFIPEFLPTLYYKGTGIHNLLCFTVIGTFVQNSSNDAPFYQSMNDLINEKFLQPNDKSITHLIQNSVREANCTIDPVKAIQDLKSYKELWVKK